MMQWTKNEPKQTGWYWIRWSGDTSDADLIWVEKVEMGSTSRTFVVQGKPIDIVDFYTTAAEFFGPISAPDDEKPNPVDQSAQSAQTAQTATPKPAFEAGDLVVCKFGGTVMRVVSNRRAGGQFFYNCTSPGNGLSGSFFRGEIHEKELVKIA